MQDEPLRELWARSSTLEERLSGMFVAVAGGEEEAQERYEAWQGLVGDLERRLAYEGWSEVLPFLGTVAARPDAPLPESIQIIAEVMQESADNAEILNVPFSRFLVPFLKVGRKRLQQRRGPALPWPDPAIRNGAEETLVSRLVSCSQQLLYAELKAERESGGEEGAYARLISRVTGPNRFDFLLNSAAMTRAMGTVLLHWVEATAEFLARFTADSERWPRLFGPLSSLSFGLGDPHLGGRSVARLRFQDGRTLYYKPRDQKLDLAFSTFLRAAEEQGAPCRLRLPSVWAGDGYGWIEGIEARPAETEEDVRLFFERGGALLAYGYLLDLSDCHSGNLIASGADPVLIDLETVCHQRARDLDDHYSDAERRVRVGIAESVLGIGLLPAARWERDLRVELGGLSPGGTSETQVDELHWLDLNTDGMRPQMERRVGGPGDHQLRFGGQVVSIRDQQASLLRGFTQTWQFLSGWTTAPFSLFADCEARFVFRGTMVYGALLDRVNAPELSRDGVDRSLLFDVLARAYLESDERPSIWPMLRNERAALQNLDVPHFRTSTSEDTLRIAGTPPMAGYLVGTALDRLRQRHQRLSASNLHLQCRFIRGALSEPLKVTATRTEVPGPPVEAAELLATALKIGEELRATAVWGEDGSVSWFDCRIDAVQEEVLQRPLPLDLGDGAAGILLFLAALERMGAPVADLRNAIRRHLSLCLPQILAKPLGGVSGAASVAYALAESAELCDDAAALDLATDLVQEIPLPAIEADTLLDVAGGVAGTLLCFTRIREIAETAGHTALQSALLARIRACAERLRTVAAESPDGTIPTLAGAPQTGFSHGHAGIALALSRLRPEDGPNLPLLQTALRFERSHFSVEHQNWCDLRADAASPCACAWCHGAAGIGLSRAWLLDLFPTDPELRQELEIAARTTAAEPIAVLDHLCCGNMGLIQSLQILAKKTGNQALEQRAHTLMSAVLRDAERRGGFHTLIGAPAAQQSLGLFTGLAGIGYSCLRLLNPSLPAILGFASAC